MTIKPDAGVDLGNDDKSPSGQSPAASDLQESNGVEFARDELERKHCQLMEMQGQTPDEELIAQAREFVDQVRQLGAVLEGPRVRQHWQGILDYWSIYAYRVKQVDLETDLVPFDPACIKPLSDDQYPYAFADEAAKDTQNMLGWRRLLDECEKDLASDQLLTIVGEAGSGRRLLLEDLFVPVLREGRARRPELKGSEDWRYYHVDIGQEPLQDVLKSLAKADTSRPPLDIDQTANWVTELAAAIRKDPAKLAELLETKSDQRQLFVIKDFERLLLTSADDRDAITAAFQCLLDDPQKRYFLAVTLNRGQAFALKKFGPLENPLRNGQVLLAFTTAELRHLINEPAERVGLVFDSGVVDKILINIQGEPTALPLLQFTMRRLWRHRERNRISSNAYQECGAGSEAIRIAMDEVYQDLQPNHQELFRRILLEMVQLDATSHFAVSPVSQDDLNRICGDPNAVEQIIDRMHEEELIYDKLVGNKRFLILSSQTVLSAWPTLVVWLDDMRDEHKDRLRLKTSSTQWQDQDKSDDLLWRRGRLEVAEAKFASDSSLTTPEREFLAASRRYETRKRIFKVAAIGLPILVFLAFVCGYPFIRQQVERQQRRYGDAARLLNSGDLSGALLQLDAMRNEAYLPMALTVRDAKLRAMRKMQDLTQIQMPALSSRTLLLPSPQSGENDQNNFASLAISPVIEQSQQQYVAMIHAVKTDDGEQCIVEVSEVSSPEKVIFRDQVAKQASGCAAFLKLGDALYLFVGTYRLQYLKMPLSADHQWQASTEQWQQILMPAGYKDVVALEAVAAPTNKNEPVHGWLSVIWKTPDNQHQRLTIHKLTSASDSFVCSEPLIPVGLEGSTQIAAVNGHGDLVVATGDVQGQANALQAWRLDRNSDKPTWLMAKPPTWVEKIKEDNPRRLSDWGWMLSESVPPAWQRIESFTRSISFSPSGSQFAIAGDDGQVLVWNFGDELSLDVEGKIQSSYATFYSPEQGVRNGAKLTVGPRIETELWLGSSVFDVAFINENLLITGGRDRTARIWDLHSSAEILPPTYQEGTVSRVAFAEPDKIVTLTQNTFRTWSSQDYRMLKSPAIVQQVAVNKSGSRVAVVPESPNFNLKPIKKLFDSKVEVVGGNQDQQVVATVVSPDGAWVFTAYGSADSDAEPLSIQSMSVRNLLDDVPYSLSMPTDFNGRPLAAFSAGESCRWLVVAESLKSDAPKIYRWDLNSLSQESAAGQRITLPSLEQEPVTGSATSSARTVRALDMAHYRNADVLAVVGKQMSEGKGKGFVYVGRFDPEKPTDSRLKSIKTDGFPHEEEVLCVGFSPLQSSGLVLAAGDAHDDVKLYNVSEFVKDKPGSAQEPKLLAILDHSSNVESLAFSPSGDLLASVSSEGEASLWTMSLIGSAGTTYDVPEHKLRHEAKILSLSFSPSGRWIITGGRDRKARVWSSEGEPVGVFIHSFPVTKAWMLDDDRILTFSQRARSSREDQSQESMPRLHFWDSSQSSALSTADLQSFAARQVVENGLEPLKYKR